MHVADNVSRQLHEYIFIYFIWPMTHGPPIRGSRRETISINLDCLSICVPVYLCSRAEILQRIHKMYVYAIWPLEIQVGVSDEIS